MGAGTDDKQAVQGLLLLELPLAEPAKGRREGFLMIGVFYSMSDVTVIPGDCLVELCKLSSESVHCCVTSPPYWGLRDYGTEGQIGLEATPQEYVAKMVAVFAEVRRVLRSDGTCWVNLGDSYAGGGNYRGLNSESTLAPKQASNRGARGLSQQLGAAGKETGLEPKNLIGIPWRVAFALQADGWYLRSDIIWHKPNPMPESVTDRPTKSHEYIFLLSKSERYWYDAEAIKEPAVCQNLPGRGMTDTRLTYGQQNGGNSGLLALRNRLNDQGEPDSSRNKRSVWTVPSAPCRDAHFATFPPDLIKPCILAGCPAGGVVLDPFGGSGTTGMVALELGRSAILIELNQDYVKLIHERTNITPGFLL